MGAMNVVGEAIIFCQMSPPFWRSCILAGEYTECVGMVAEWANTFPVSTSIPHRYQFVSCLLFFCSSSLFMAWEWQGFGTSSTAVPDHKQQAEWELEQPHKSVPQTFHLMVSVAVDDHWLDPFVIRNCKLVPFKFFHSF